MRQLYNQVPQKARVSSSYCSSQLGTKCQIESLRQTEGFEPRLSSPARMRKKCCYGQKNLESICNSLSLSLTHLLHTTKINPFENKVWEIYFYKEACSFVHWSSSLLLTMFPLIFVYVYVLCSCIMWLYNTKTDKIYLERMFPVGHGEFQGKPKCLSRDFEQQIDPLTFRV